MDRLNPTAALRKTISDQGEGQSAEPGRQAPPAAIGTSLGEQATIALAVLGLLAIAGGVVLTLRPVLPNTVVVALLAVAAVSVAALLILTLTLSQQLRARVRQMREVASEIGLGDLSARAPVDAGDDLGVLGLALNTMADRIARQLQANRDLLAGVSHELRSPLTRIDVLLELLRAEQMGSGGEELLAAIGEETALLERHISRLLEAQRVGLGRVLLDRHPLDLPDLVTKVLRRETRRLQQLGVTVSVDLDRLPFAEVLGDENALDRVFSTLIENVVQHGLPAPETPALTEPLLVVQGRREELAAVVTFADRGPGVSPEQLQQIFEAFYRGDRSRALGQGGTGLGLYLVRKLVEAHGGQARAYPRDGGGLCVEVRLPLHGESNERETMRVSQADIAAALREP